MTTELLLRTRQHFADLHQACIDDATNGKYRVNDLDRYIEQQNQLIVDSLAGKSDHTFTFQQRAHYLATGESIPFLS